ncbi:hypothetical protein K504DRAFT_520827, partial [Pleomassaria siparia CBS 279.74]
SRHKYIQIHTSSTDAGRLSDLSKPQRTRSNIIIIIIIITSTPPKPTTPTLSSPPGQESELQMSTRKTMVNAKQILDDYEQKKLSLVKALAHLSILKRWIPETEHKKNGDAINSLYLHRVAVLLQERESPGDILEDWEVLLEEAVRMKNAFKKKEVSMEEALATVKHFNGVFEKEHHNTLYEMVEEEKLAIKEEEAREYLEGKTESQ